MPLSDILVANISTIINVIVAFIGFNIVLFIIIIDMIPENSCTML